jgi:hypothetical protein
MEDSRACRWATCSRSNHSLRLISLALLILASSATVGLSDLPVRRQQRVVFRHKLLLHTDEVYPGAVAQLVEFFVSLHDLQLGFQVDLVIVLRLQVVFFGPGTSSSSQFCSQS